MLRWIKRILLGLLLLAIAGVIIWAMLPRPVPVEIVPIARGPLAVTVDDDGRARVEDRHVIVAPLAGALARIEMHPGDAVTPDSVVARIAPLPSPLLDARTQLELEGRHQIAEAQERLALAAVERAKLQVDYAKKEVEQGRALAAAKAITGDEVDRRALTLDLAKRELQSARFGAAVTAKEVATAAAMLERMSQPSGSPAAVGGDEEVIVYPPVGGRILRVITESEGVVGVGTPLVEIGDPSQLEVVAEVLTADAVSIQPGAAVSIEGWGGGPVAGQVRMVEPSARTRVSALGVEEQRVAVVIDFTDPPETWAALGDGWRVEVRITTWRSAEVLRVPLGALFRSEDRWAVYLLDGDVVRLRPLEVGHRNTTYAEVLSGLEPGNQVVLHPSSRVQDGIRVLAR